MQHEQDPAQRLSLRAQYSALGVTDPGDLIKSEVMEDLPQLPRFVLLRSLWHGAIDAWAESAALAQLPAAQGLLAAGATQADLVRLVRAVAYEAVFATLDELDAGGGANVSGVGPGWGGDGDGRRWWSHWARPVGPARDLLTMDPSGRDGADLWQ